MKNPLQSNIWKFYATTGLLVNFTAPIRILYLISFGLSYTQIGLMEFAAALAIVLLELPSGIFADIVGRKASQLISFLLSTTAFSLLSFGSSAPIFIFGWALSGAADAFQSGSQDALIYDTLQALGKEKDYVKLKSHFLLITTLTAILGSIVGAQLYTLDHRFPWYLLTLSIILSAILFSTIQEPPRSATPEKTKFQFKLFTQSLLSSLSSIRVIGLITVSIVLSLPMYIFTTLMSQPYLVSRGFSIESLGVVFAMITGISGIVASFSHILERIFKKKFSFFVIFLSFTALLILMGLWRNQLVLLLVIGFYLIDSYKNIIFDTYINQSIDSYSRASVLSVSSFMQNIVVSILFIGIGSLIDAYGIDAVLIATGLVIACAGILFFTFLYKRTEFDLK